MATWDLHETIIILVITASYKVISTQTGPFRLRNTSNNYLLFRIEVLSHSTEAYAN